MAAIRVYTASGGWQDIALVGPTGPQGATGPAGPVGPTGPATGTVRTGQSYIISGLLAAGQVIPTFFVPIFGVGQTTKIIGVRAKIASGTSIVAQLQQNGTNIGSAITVTPTKATTTFGTPITIADGDEIGLVLSSAVATPANLSLTVIFEHTI